jgi:hypothetical protein
MKRSPPGREERLIGALVPRPIPRPPPPSAVLPILPARRSPTESDSVLLDAARLDGSGRVSARGLLRALGWPAGHRVEIDVVDGDVVIRSTPTGRHTVGGRGDLALPAAARHMCGIELRQPVLLAAYPAAGLVVVHSAATIARLLVEVHNRLLGGADAG